MLRLLRLLRRWLLLRLLRRWLLLRLMMRLLMLLPVCYTTSPTTLATAELELAAVAYLVSGGQLVVGAHQV